MTKKHFISLAKLIKNNQDTTGFTPDAIEMLGYWLSEQNRRFNRDKWLAYIKE